MPLPTIRAEFPRFTSKSVHICLTQFTNKKGNIPAADDLSLLFFCIAKCGAEQMSHDPFASKRPGNEEANDGPYDAFAPLQLISVRGNVAGS